MGGAGTRSGPPATKAPGASASASTLCSTHCCIFPLVLNPKLSTCTSPLRIFRLLRPVGAGSCTGWSTWQRCSAWPWPGAAYSPWLLLHMLFTLRYAHVYFSEDPTASPPGKLGGLQFVGEPTARSLRGLRLLCLHHRHDGPDLGHGRDLPAHAPTYACPYLAFNTAVVALGINIISSIL